MFSVDITGYNFFNVTSPTSAGGENQNIIKNINQNIENQNELLGQFNQDKYQVFILGDMNIDFIKFNNDQQTEKNLR